MTPIATPSRSNGVQSVVRPSNRLAGFVVGELSF